MRHYTKTFRSHADQLSLLKERGLSIGDVVGAEKILESINYYRFTGYALPFMIDNLRVDGAKEISKSYGIKWNILGSYLQHLSVLRNFCAHHSRLYDRKFYKFHPLNEWRTTHPGLSDTGAFFYQAVLCHRLSVCVKSTCFDRDSWRQRICQAFASAPRILCFDLPGLMGIPTDPARSPLWV